MRSSPLRFQLDVPWESATPEANLQCVEKASEDCRLVFNMIAPESGAELYQFITCQSGIEPSSDLEVLMMAYKNAKTSSLRTQILSLYAFRYPIPVLMKLHKPYENLTRYQLKRARKHAKIHGPGTVPEKELKYRVRLDMAKVDHFLEFANRPYFYQDVGIRQPSCAHTPFSPPFSELLWRKSSDIHGLYVVMPALMRHWTVEPWFAHQIACLAFPSFKLFINLFIWQLHEYR